MNVLAFIDVKDGKPIGTSLELLTAAKEIGETADAILVGEGLEEAAQAAAKCGAGKVSVVEAEGLLTEEALSSILAQAAEAYDLLLLSATTLGKTITPQVAGKLGDGSANDVIKVSVEDGKVKVLRPVYSGNLQQELAIKTDKAVVSVRGGSYDKPQEEGEAAPVEKLDLAAEEDALRSKIVDVIAEAGETVNLEDAKVVVCGGRGMGTKEDFESLCGALADVLGGVVGASRPVIDSEWISRTRQVGQSGKIISPDLYIGCGISGASQHVSGMRDSKYIIAINKDEEAPIFEIANLGIVGDVKKVIPILVEEIKKRKESEG